MKATQTLTGRERFIQIAAELFLTDGFGPVGLDQIIDAAGVTKTTFYKHFESKDDLILAVIEAKHIEEMESMAEYLRLHAKTPREQILAFFDAIDLWLADNDFRGCIFLNAATEFPHESDPIHKAAIHHGDAVVTLMREKAIECGADKADAQQFAMDMYVLITGAIMTRRTAGQRDAAKLAKRTAEMLLERLLRKG